MTVVDSPEPIRVVLEGFVTSRPQREPSGQLRRGDADGERPDSDDELTYAEE